MILSIAQVIFVGTSIALVILILLQQTKGSGIGASFGAGASATVFGARGAGSFLYKLTRFLSLVFFLSALSMGYFMNKSATSGNILAGVVSEENTQNVSQSNVTDEIKIPETAVENKKIQSQLDKKPNSGDNNGATDKVEIPLDK